MAKDKFIWIGEQTTARGTAGGRILEKGKEYPLGGITVEIVEEWVRSGHAKWAGKDKPAKED